MENSTTGAGSVSRRDFLKKSGGAAALAATGSFLIPKYSRAAAADTAITPGGADWIRYGYDIHNTRFNAKETTIGPKNVDKLKLRWKFDTLDHWPIQTTPTVIGNSLFFGAGGYYYSLDSATGALRWKFETGLADNASQSSQQKGTRSSAHYVDGKIYFGDGWAIVHCLDAATGRQIWKRNVEPDRGMGSSMRYSVVVHNGKVHCGYIGRDPKIVCLDAETGAIRWSFRIAQNIPDNRKTGLGPLWTSGAIDEKQNIVYNVTGDPKAFMPPGPMLYADCMLAHDADTGELLWHYQPHPQDTADYDFDANPVVFDAVAPPRGRGDIRPCVVAGSKGGIFCCNRYTGQLYWKVMLGTPSGGSGPQTDAISVAYNKVYVKYASPGSTPGLATTAALNAYNGDIEWIRPNPFQGESPITVANGVLYQSYNVGRIFEALDAMTGKKLWETPMPSDVHAGSSIANGALYVGNGEGQSFHEQQVSYPYSLFSYTVDGK